MANILCVDPGESTGWSLWDKEGNLLDAGTEEMWLFADAVYGAVLSDPDELELTDNYLAMDLAGVDTIICENWRIYPWEAKAGTLDWDQCRTARLIGALTLIAQRGALTWILQDAKIKERAEAAGAAHFFLSPLHENRHANDSIRHGVYYFAVQRGIALAGATHVHKSEKELL